MAQNQPYLQMQGELDASGSTDICAHVHAPSHSDTIKDMNISIFFVKNEHRECILSGL